MAYRSICSTTKIHAMTNSLSRRFPTFGKMPTYWGKSNEWFSFRRQTKTRLVCYKKNNYKWQILILTTNQYVYLEDSCERWLGKSIQGCLSRAYAFNLCWEIGATNNSKDCHHFLFDKTFDWLLFYRTANKSDIKVVIWTTLKTCLNILTSF